MPDDAAISNEPKETSSTKQGLAAIDLLTDDTNTRPTSRYEEYKADGDEEPRRIEPLDEPVRGEIEVVKVKRKKKKDSSKKKVEA
jgi:hypothetical protein